VSCEEGKKRKEFLFNYNHPSAVSIPNPLQKGEGKKRGGKRGGEEKRKNPVHIVIAVSGSRGGTTHGRREEKGGERKSK